LDILIFVTLDVTSLGYCALRSYELEMGDENSINFSKVLKLHKQVFNKYGKFVKEMFYVECKVIGGVSKRRLDQ